MCLQGYCQEQVVQCYQCVGGEKVIEYQCVGFCIGQYQFGIVKIEDGDKQVDGGC